MTRISHHGDEGLRQAGSVPAVEFTLDGRPFAAINGGPQSHFDEAVSFLIECADQAEVDHYWGRLTDGGEESMCGWLRDCYGVSWQVVPRVLNELIDDPDEERAGRARAAMLQIRKIDVDALLAAAEGG